MFKFFISLVCLSSFLLAQNLKTYTNYEEAVFIAKKENKPLLMFVYTDYCPWCTKMKKNTFSQSHIIEFINKNYIFVSINKEKDAFPKKFMPRYIPTTYLIDVQKEEEVYALYGYKTDKEFLHELEDEE